MKTITKLFLLILVVVSIQVNAQQWAKSLEDKKNPTFFEIQKAFNDYYKANPDEQNPGEENDGDFEKFKRWEWYWEQRVSTTGEFPPNDIVWNEWNKYIANQSSKREKNMKSSGNWMFKGPSTSTGGYSGIGRVSCIAFHPTNPNTFWVGTPGGGLWKTTDAGSTWSTNTDYFPVLGISDIAIDQNNPNSIYVATGDGDWGSLMGCTGGAIGDTKSIGVLHSGDGGNTWYTTGLNWSVTTPKLIRRLILNPLNSQNLIAVASDGIWLTSDGGTTWTNEATGYYFMDVVFNPTNPNYVYATTRSNGNAQIYISTDGGYTWMQVTSFSGITRIKLAVSPMWPDEVDAVTVNTSSGLNGLYYSVDDGATFTEYWTATDCSYNLLTTMYPPTTSTCNGQGVYDLAYAIDPSDFSKFYLGGVNTWSSVDSGLGWSPNNYRITGNGNPGVPVVHSDKHWLAFHPLNNNYIFECNGGGVYYSNNGGVTWNDITNGIQNSEIYRISVSATVQNDVICGLQDNGTKQYNSNSWSDVQGGDGFQCLIDYTNANIEYASYTYGQISKSTDGGVSWNVIVNNNGAGVNEHGNWVTPYVMHPTNHNTLLVGKTQIYRTTDGGSTWSQLGTISDTNHLFIAIAYASSNTQTIYACTFHELYVTTNGGGVWTLIGTNSNAMNNIAVDPNNSQRVWVTNAGYTNSHVSYSPDGGTTWYDYTGTLPNLPANCIVYQTGSNDGLYIGTDVGVYYTNANLTDWIPYNTGLPNVLVTDLKISYNNNKLWAGTFGRGLWNSDLYSNTTGVSSFNNNSYVNLYPNPNNGNFTLAYQLSSSIGEFQIYDVVGRVVYNYSINSIEGTQNIDASSLSNGIYYWQLSTGNEASTKGKMVILK